MLPIKILLSSCNKMIDPEALDIDGLYIKFFTSYATQQSKMASTGKRSSNCMLANVGLVMSKSFLSRKLSSFLFLFLVIVKAEVLEVLGIISRVFPSVAQERHPQVMRWCINIIQDQLKAGSKQELLLIAGAANGLDNCLYNFSEKAAKDVPVILQIVKTLVNVPEDIHRFAAPIGEKFYLQDLIGESDALKKHECSHMYTIFLSLI